jgi:hypothetical protein
VFVNNVSLGLYGDAVQRSGYRDAKLRTLLDTVPDVLAPRGGAAELRWNGPAGREHRFGPLIVVSNNRYRLDRATGFGTRAGIHDGELGIAVAGGRPGVGDGGRPPLGPWRAWSATAFEVDADQAVSAGIDGEAATLKPPLRFRTLPGVLRVRVARHHPGAASAVQPPEEFAGSAGALARFAAGRWQGAQSQRRMAPRTRGA